MFYDPGVATVFGSSERVRLDRAGLRQILDHRYWHRAWIWQEVGLSRKLRIACGQYVLTSEQSNCLLRRLMDFEERSDVKEHLSLINRIAVGGRTSLLDVMIATRYSGCSEPRDALYAKMHVTRNSSLLGGPDYTESVSSLFIRFAVFCIDGSTSLRILAFSSGYRNKLRMPSSAVDWTPRNNMPETQLVKGFESALKMSSPAFRASFDCEKQVLIVHGRIVKEMQAFKQPKAMHTHVADLSHSIAAGIELEPPATYDEAFLCMIFGCPTLLVLARQGDHYVIVNVGESTALQRWT